jgi:hypothetical protein
MTMPTEGVSQRMAERSNRLAAAVGANGIKRTHSRKQDTIKQHRKDLPKCGWLRE